MTSYGRQKLDDEIQAAGIVGRRIILGKVGAQIAVGKGAGEGVDHGMTEHVAVGMGVEPVVGRDRHTAEHQGLSGHQAMDVVAQPDPLIRVHTSRP